ncbi:MAG TPA: hypothetical protein PLU87_11175 [Sedimentisphaerales bacterium]|nr:hypothetical protein [Sedimentisphaerales bacterium]HRS11044.1 hypothetical protein [Sedimentisphaerales bacterium]HRV49698.1 hypothetical protein [Sedimentisphaerales bacterium]
MSVVGLLVMVAAAVQVVLWTDLPRTWVVRAAGERLGLDVTAAALSVGWTGRTTIRDVTLTAPLDEEPMFSAQAIEVTHRSVPMLLVRRSLGLDSVRLDKPQISLRRNVSGRWNIQDVVARLAGGRSAGPARTALPRLDVRDAFIRVMEPNETIRTVGPISAFGANDGRSVWEFHVKAPQGVELHGQVTQGGNWAHRIDFAIDPSESLREVVRSSGLAPTRAAGCWVGRMEAGGLAGALRLERFEGGSIALAGAVDVVVRRDSVVLTPRDVMLFDPNLGGRFDGFAELGITSPLLGRKEMTLRAALAGRGRFGDLRIGIEARGAGADWRKSLWEVSVSELAWKDSKREIDLAGTGGKVAVDWPQVRLTSLMLPNAQQVNAAAELDAQTGRWSGQIDVSGLKRSAEGLGLDIHIHASGSRQEAVISELAVTAGERMATARGKLALSTGEIRDAHLAVRWSSRQTGEASEENMIQWACEADLGGTLRPVVVQLNGTMTGRNIRLGRRMVSQLEIPWKGTVDIEQVRVSTEPFDLLGGRWQLRGRHEMSVRLTQLGLAIDNLSLQAVGEMAGLPLKGEGHANAQLQLAVPNFALDKAQAYGTWEIEDLRMPPFEAQKGHGRLRIADGVAKLDEIMLEQASGRAHGSMEFPLDQPHRPVIQVRTSQWPLTWESQELELLVDGEVKATLDIQKKSLDGQVEVVSQLSLKREPLGWLRACGRLQERALDVRELGGELLGGRLQGAAKIPLDRWTASAGQIQWQGIELSRLAGLWPAAADFQGDVTGTLVAGPKDPEVRALEPLRLELHAEIPDGHFRRVRLDGCHLTAYVGEQRLLVDKIDIHMAGGLLEGWTRVSRRDDEFHFASVIDFNDIDLNELSQVTTSGDRSRMYGRLAGRATLLTSSDWRHLSGQADLSISQSDLGATPILRTLYDALNLNLGPSKPEGTGQVKVQFDGMRIRIPSFVYFNRGVEVRGAGGIEDLTRGLQSPIEGYAVGSTRVLKGIRLPGVRELDRLMASLQTGAASVTIAGTLARVEVAIVPLPVVSGPLRHLLWSQLRE